MQDDRSPCRMTGVTLHMGLNPQKPPPPHTLTSPAVRASSLPHMERLGGYEACLYLKVEHRGKLPHSLPHNSH
ncbi:hypothetical protein T484DRAFT_1988969 [Baffinella frigidus]|nr:hypothetical protein T484DRAFT_1988969 [Cryptophyta sp. CCMP2293]